MSQAARASVWVFRLLALAYVATITTLSLLPVERLGRAAHNDKLNHVAGYAVMAILISLATGRVWIALIVSGMIGFAIELIQPHTGRTFDPRDVLANTIGMALGAVLVGVSRLIFRRPAPPA